jgi:hypothetical protein
MPDRPGIDRSEARRPTGRAGATDAPDREFRELHCRPLAGADATQHAAEWLRFA